jgi:hypothetical protein
MTVQTLTDELLGEIEAEAMHWLCGANAEKTSMLITELRTLRAENAEFRKTLSSLKWRIEDISSDLTARRGGDGESFYGLDEWSVPIINLSRAVGVIDTAMEQSK